MAAYGYSGRVLRVWTIFIVCTVHVHPHGLSHIHPHSHPQVPRHTVARAAGVA
jgi:transcriptional accessory protein Tex/SPT6